MLPLCSYTPTISAKLPPSFSFAPPQPHRPSDPYIKFSTVVAEFASTPLATFNNAQHATSTNGAEARLWPDIRHDAFLAEDVPAALCAGLKDCIFGVPTGRIRPPASKFTWRRRRVAPALWSLFKLPRASDTFNIANVGVALPLKVLLEFWGSRKPVPSITLMRLPIKLAGVGGGA
ncbi:hypothetical protein C8R43DRAFT_1127186 [Mycena crocata]|nr:hypothetical protein C8R43DRAFT_1127186 [Mycena crocata]